MPSVGERLGTTQSQDLLLLGALALAGYVLYNLVQGVKASANVVGAAAQGLTSVGAALGSGLYSLFGPSDAQVLGEMTFLTVSFPDGGHAVPASSVKSDGTFSWTGYPAGSQPPVTYQLVKDANNRWFATIPDFGVTNTTGWS